MERRRQQRGKGGGGGGVSVGKGAQGSVFSSFWFLTPSSPPNTLPAEAKTGGRTQKENQRGDHVTHLPPSAQKRGGSWGVKYRSIEVYRSIQKWARSVRKCNRRSYPESRVGA